MIADFPTMLLILLAVLTVLGAIVGYCAALIRTKRTARTVIEEARLELKREQRSARTDLESARNKIGSLRASEQQGPNAKKAATERERALQRYSQQQTQQIKTLEAKLASLETKQGKLRQEFANYRTKKARELELAHAAPGSLAETDKLPTLSRRVEPASGMQANAGVSPPYMASAVGELPWRKRDELNKMLTPDLDIPTLAESELPDLVDELEFDLSGAEDSGAGSRG